MQSRSQERRDHGVNSFRETYSKISGCQRLLSAKMYIFFVAGLWSDMKAESKSDTVCMSVQTEVALQTNTCVCFRTTCKSGPNLMSLKRSDSVGFVLFPLPLNNQIGVTWRGPGWGGWGIRFGPLGPAV